MDRPRHMGHRSAGLIGGLIVALAATALGEEEAVVLKNATVHTGEGVIESGQVRIEGERITEVGSDVAASDARAVDLDGLHLFPGLIAASSVAGLVEISAIRATRDEREVGDFTPDVTSWIAVNPDSEVIPVTRANGITHALVVPTGGRLSGQSGLVAFDGWTSEEMTIRSPVAMHLFWPSMELDTRPKTAFDDPSQWESPEEQAKEREEKIREIDRFFDDAEAYWKARRASGAADNVKQPKIPAWEAMGPVLKGEIPLMIHADESRQIERAVEWAREREYAMILAGGRDAWEVRSTLAEHDIPVIYEATFDLPRRQTDRYDVQFKAPRLLHEAGVRFAFGHGLSSFENANLRNLPYQAAHAVAYGLPRQAALRALTRSPAEILGVDDRLGTIAPGKEATFFAATGPIFDVRAQVARVWIAGKEVSLQNRHRRLYEKYRERPRPEADRE